MKNVTLITNKTNYDSLSLPKNTHTSPSQSFTVYIDLTPTYYYPAGTYTISMIDEDFKFGSSCTNIAHTCETTTETVSKCANITALETNKSTCSVTNNKIIFDITTDIIAGQTLRL